MPIAITAPGEATGASKTASARSTRFRCPPAAAVAASASNGRVLGVRSPSSSLRSYASSPDTTTGLVPSAVRSRANFIGSPPGEQRKIDAGATSRRRRVAADHHTSDGVAEKDKPDGTEDGLTAQRSDV